MRDDDSSDAWLKHKRTLNAPASVMLRRSGIELEEKSVADIGAIEQIAMDTYLSSSRRRLDQMTPHTWALLMLFGVFRHPGTELLQRNRARDSVARMINPMHDDIDGSVANYISRAIGRK